MKKITVIIILFLGIALTVQAQQSLVVGGGKTAGSGGSSTYSVGQVFYKTNSGTNGVITEGLQQAFEISLITGIENIVELTCSVYPNPTANFLTLRVKNEDYTKLYFQLYDAAGRLFERREIKTNKTSITMSHLNAGIYFLKIMQNTDSPKEINTFKIIKN